MAHGLDNILNRGPPSAWEHFCEGPLVFLARFIHNQFPLTLHPLPSKPIRVVCVSDTHNAHHDLPPLPQGDILIHSGDLTQSGTEEELKDTLDWLVSQPHAHKVFIAGNHDRCLSDFDCRESLRTRCPDLTYLHDTPATLSIHDRRLNIYGSPRTPKHGSWPFQYPRVVRLSSDSAETDPWSDVPLNTDILITHGPPAHHLDAGYGCLALLRALWRVRPRLHVFGHIHAARGAECVPWQDDQLAYENILAGQGGWFSLLRVVLGAVQRLFGGRRKEGASLLVNASSIGGFRDDNRNPAIVIDI
ncbi:hypothetical protein NLJ89_g5661 [Agrocybe chaxingu]|uniref:Calcineurin-like phosphoesterase domain-containing protein n=1 Tax=Agrocybe chaxingu TaxID=84603 RepID=A0A9W8JZT5_9AGAR|nr:hypothetical protein NLJ89_g5661 [Agrocybe chaxingu]